MTAHDALLRARRADIGSRPDTRMVFRARSSAGEHYLDMVGVTGSIPVAPTIRFKDLAEISVDYERVETLNLAAGVRFLRAGLSDFEFGRAFFVRLWTEARIRWHFLMYLVAQLRFVWWGESVGHSWIGIENAEDRRCEVCRRFDLKPVLDLEGIRCATIWFLSATPAHQKPTRLRSPSVPIAAQLTNPSRCQSAPCSPIPITTERATRLTS